MTRVVQYHASIPGMDAIGNSMALLDSALSKHGIESYLICKDDQLPVSRTGVVGASALLNTRVKDSLGTDDLLLIHYSFLDPVAAELARLPMRKALVYHNITPGHFFRGTSMDWIAGACDAARDELAAMRGEFDLAVGDSDYNSDELRAMRFVNVRTIPVMIKDSFFNSWGNQDDNISLVYRNYAQTNILFVGRFVPNKRIELLIDMIAVYRRSFDPTAVLHLVGKVWDQTYYAQLVDRAASLGVANALRVHFELNAEGLATLFATSDALVCMSEHEGFMVPVIEAFAAGCPVIAYGGSAVGETMGDAGLQLPAPDPELASGLLYLLKSDPALRLRLVEEGARRAYAFRPAQVEQRWIDALNSLVPLS